MKMAAQTTPKVASSVAKREAFAPAYGKARSEIVDQLTAHQRGRFVSNNPYAFLANSNASNLSWLAD